MNAVTERQRELVQKFQKLPSWQGRYKEIIAMGKALPEMPKEIYQEQFLVKGCQSQVWLKAQPSEGGKVVFLADSDALIVKGLVALLLELYSGAKATDIIEAPKDFIAAMGFSEALSPSRANGLLAMMKQIHLYATALSMMPT